MFTRHKQTFLDKVIFVDVDDTLADTRQGVYDLYKETTGDSSGDIYIKTKKYTEFCPLWTDDQVSFLFENPDMLYARIKPIEGAKDAINTLLSKGYDIRIATIHVPSGIYAKQKWIDEHFPMLSNKVYYINCNSQDKDVFCGHSIIDDDAKNVDYNRSEKPILLDVYGIYENRKGQSGYASNWKEVIDKLK